MTTSQCINCDEPIFATDFITRDGYGATVHANCDIAAWRRNHKQGPRPGTKQHEIDVVKRQRQTSGRNQQRPVDTTRAGSVTTTRPDGTTTTERARTPEEQARIVAKGKRAPRTWNESNTEVHKTR